MEPQQEQSQRSMSKSPVVTKPKKVVTKSKYKPVRIRHSGTLKAVSRGNKNAVKSLTKKVNTHNDALQILKTYWDEKEKVEMEKSNKRMEALEAKIDAMAKQMASVSEPKEKVEYVPIVFREWNHGVVAGDPLFMFNNETDLIITFERSYNPDIDDGFSHISFNINGLLACSKLEYIYLNITDSGDFQFIKNNELIENVRIDLYSDGYDEGNLNTHIVIENIIAIVKLLSQNSPPNTLIEVRYDRLQVSTYQGKLIIGEFKKRTYNVNAEPEIKKYRKL